MKKRFFEILIIVVTVALAYIFFRFLMPNRTVAEEKGSEIYGFLGTVAVASINVWMIHIALQLTRSRGLLRQNGVLMLGYFGLLVSLPVGQYFGLIIGGTMGGALVASWGWSGTAVLVGVAIGTLIVSVFITGLAVALACSAGLVFTPSGSPDKSG